MNNRAVADSNGIAQGVVDLRSSIVRMFSPKIKNKKWPHQQVIECVVSHLPLTQHLQDTANKHIVPLIDTGTKAASQLPS